MPSISLIAIGQGPVSRYPGGGPEDLLEDKWKQSPSHPSRVPLQQTHTIFNLSISIFVIIKM